MVQTGPKQFSSGTVKKLHVCSTGPFKSLNKLNDNIYVIDLLKIFDISYTFNVEDLVDYDLDFNPSNSLDKPSGEPFSESPS